MAGLRRTTLFLDFLAVALLGCATPGDGGAGTPNSAGRELYERHGCALCHGPEGRGDGPVASTLDPPPRDLGDPAAYRVGASEAEIAATIESGILVFGGSGMAPYPHIPPADRLELARYIVSLQRPAPAAAPSASNPDDAETE